MRDNVKQCVADVLTSCPDDAIRDWVVAVLEDEDLELGETGAGAYDAIGDVLVSA